MSTNPTQAERPLKDIFDVMWKLAVLAVLSVIGMHLHTIARGVDNVEAQLDGIRYWMKGDRIGK